MISEKERREKLFRLMRENPDLPVVPMVETEVVCSGDFGFWMGSWGDARVDEYLIPKNGYDPMMFKSDDEDAFGTPWRKRAST